MNSINTDIKSDSGNPSKILESISKAGFSHIQWCHHWCTDFLYTKPEIDFIRAELQKNNLLLLETHASMGREKQWYSDTEYQRQAGVLLVENRMEFTKALGGDVIVLHPFQTLDPEVYEKWFESSVKSLKELYAVYERTGVKIALENMRSQGTYALIEQLFAEFPKDFVVYCWDTGHSNNIGVDVFEDAAKLARDRLYTLHLNDNTAIGADEHRCPFDGSHDWDRVAKVIAESPYPKGRPYTCELAMKTYDLSVSEFLDRALNASNKMSTLIESYK